MRTGLFATYRGGENRVTASILAVLRSLALSRTERLLSALTDDARLELLAFRNQVAGPAGTVPDAEIMGSCRLLFETKLTRNAVRLSQVQGHLVRLDESAEAFRALLVLTPDHVRPSVLTPLTDPRVYWASFAALDQAIDDLLADKTEVISEREAFLLRELQRMLDEEDLVSFPKDTVIVAAKRAWSVYQDVSAYVCQPDRPFQRVQYLGFYVDGEIRPTIPRILEVHERVVFTRGQHNGALGALVETMLDRGLVRDGDEQKVFLLSGPDESDTIALKSGVVNDLRASTGATVAFTQNQRYVRLEDLRRASRTSQLIVETTTV